MATKSPSKEEKKKQFSGQQVIPCNFVWNKLVATRSINKGGKKHDLVATKSSFAI
jgi:hypothetical protein